jgi:hypothetical protein
MNRGQPTHNLQIQSYSLEELLGLFDLKSYDLNMSDIKRAKNRVLMLHPDKSRLSAEYFLFYKKAFDVVYQFYETQNRQNQTMDENTTKYKPTQVNDHNSATNKQINKVIENMGHEGFQNKFNELFESNNMADRPDPKRNEWFSKDEPAYSAPDGQSVSAKNMGQVFENMKKQGTGLVKYRGVEQMYTSGTTGAGNLYDSQGDDDHYVSSDPFSKLKFDDLRKVHKDQTVFAVSEADFGKVQQYSSVDHYNRERSKQSYDPIDKQKAQQILSEQERILKEQMMRKQYEATKKSQEYADKNKSILSSFLQLGN